MSGPGVDDPAPDFTLPGTGGREYSLSEYAGQPVLLVFYPGDDSPVCTRQLTSYSGDLAQFNELGAQVLGISPQDIESHQSFAERHGLGFPLLADTDKAVADLYGTLGPIGFPRRSCFIIDGDGIVRYTHRAIAGLTFRPVSELLAEVQKVIE